MGSARKETSAGVASSSKSKHSKLKSRSGASETVEKSNSQEFSLSQHRSKLKRCSRSDTFAKNDGVSKYTEDALTQQQILEKIASLSKLLSPPIRERAGSIMMRDDDSPSAHKSGSLSKNSRKSNASCSSRKNSASGIKTKEFDADKHEGDPDEDSEEDSCGRRAKSTTFNFLSKEKVCIYEGGQIHMDGEGKKFMRYAMELVRLHCHDIHQPWPLVKRSHKEKVLHDLKNHYGTGFSSRWVLSRLGKKWNNYRYKLRKQVRENPRMKKPTDCKKEKAWELFKEDSKKENKDKKNAAAARKRKPRTGSGGLDSIKAEFFKYYCGYPTAMQLEKIIEAGGFKEWIRTQEVSNEKFDARDFAGKGPTRCIFRAKETSKKDDEAGTSKMNPSGNDVASIDAPSVVSDSEDLDIVGLFEEKENDLGENIIKEREVNAGPYKSGSSADTDTSSSYESSSGSSSASSDSLESDHDKNGSDDEDGSDSVKEADLGTRPRTPPPKKKTVKDICKDIILKEENQNVHHLNNFENDELIDFQQYCV